MDHARSAGLHMAGVSWGGKWLAAYAASHRCEAARSLTLICPGIVPLVTVPLRTKLAIAAALATSPEKLFDIPLNDVELFTDNPAMREYLLRDPLRLRQATARFFYASRQLDRIVFKSPDKAIAMPITLILARRERIIDNPATQSLVARLAGGPLDVHQLDGAHTLEFEDDPSEFFALIVSALTLANV